MNNKSRKISFEEAKARYVHRYTMEHVPKWAKLQAQNGKYYAPQYRTDQEWYDATVFPGESDIDLRSPCCHSCGQTWPLGQWLDSPYKRN